MTGTCSIADLPRLRRGGNGGLVALSADGSVRKLPWSELDDRSEICAGALARSVAPEPDGGTPRGVILAIADPFLFAAAFFGAAKAGYIPVPGPAHPATQPRQRYRLEGIVGGRCSVAVIAEEELAGLPVPVLSATELMRDVREGNVLPGPGQDIAFIQHTSGSTGTPKPIFVRQENVFAQLGQAAEVFGEDISCVSVNWVPLFHDMGLVASLLRPLWSDYLSVILDPIDFVKRPVNWLEAISRFGGTHTTAPDFGYRLCVRKAGEPHRLDLRTVRVARNAGEVVRLDTMRRFADVFASSGFRYSAFKPSYGLAEATLTVTACSLREPPRHLTADRPGLRAGVARPAKDEDGQDVVSCGAPVPGTAIRVMGVDSDDEVPDDVIGEVWISGPQVVPPDEPTGNDRPGRRTGDLGFLHDGELYLVGRSKERFQIRGENFFSAELENILTTGNDRLRAGRTAVFVARTQEWNDEAPVAVAEMRDAGDDENPGYAGVTAAMVRCLAKYGGLSVRVIVLVPAGTLPVTTSGKLRRELCRQMFEESRLVVLHEWTRAKGGDTYA